MPAIGIGISPHFQQKKSLLSYWTTHLFGEDDLSFRSGERSGLTIVDDIGSNNISILPATVSKNAEISHYVNTGIMPAVNTIWVVLGRFPVLDQQYKVHGASDATGFFRWGIYNAPSYQYFVGFGDSFNNNSVASADTNFHVFIFYNASLWVLPPTTPMTDAAILNAIATETPVKTVTGYNWTNLTRGIQYGGHVLTGVGPKFEYALSFIGTITDNAITWQAKHVFNNQYVVIDLLGGENPAWVAGSSGTYPKKSFSAYGYNGNINVGYSKYGYAGRLDIQVPYGTDGDAIVSPVLPNGYVKYFDVPAIVNRHNLADSILVIPGDDWDRSDVTLWSDEARAATTFYDAANTNAWHISELNNLIIKNWAESGHEGKCFVRMTPGSVDIEARNGLTEILGYTTNIAVQEDIDKVHQFCGDYTILQTPYLLDPYNDVLKITATEDAEFRFNINNSIIYTKDQLWSKILAMPRRHADEDAFTTIANWLIPNSNKIGTYFTDAQHVADILFLMNSFQYGHCGPLTAILYNVLDHFYPGTIETYINDFHTSSRGDGYFFDLSMVTHVYKDRYSQADFDEIVADKYLFTEPLRRTHPSLIPYTYNTIGNWNFLKTLYHSTLYEKTGVADNLVMKLPGGTSFVFPIKSVNIPDFFSPSSYDDHFAIGICAIPTGVTGEISMPFIITQITGTGTISVNGGSYTLPDDVVAVRALFQDGSRGVAPIYTFIVLTNTGGIEAEYLINHARIRLYHDNIIDKGLIHGDINIEATRTATPVTTMVAGINKGDADSWSLYFDRWFTTNKSIKNPTFIDQNTASMVHVNFEKIGSKPRPVYFFTNGAQNAIAGDSVVDQCFAAKLMPRVEDIDASEEFSFVSIDGSITYYTLDGTTPNATKTEYTAPFTINADTLIQWINIRDGYADSHVNSRQIRAGLGTELIDQDNFYKEAWWTEVQANWRTVGGGIESDGGNGYIQKESLLTVGKTYRIRIGMTKNSGVGYIISDSTNTITGITSTSYVDITFTATNAYLKILTTNAVGQLHTLSIKEVL